MKTPLAVRNYIREFGEDELECQDYILRQLKLFATIPDKATDEQGWLAFKLGCKPSQAAAAIRWALEIAKEK
jgi:hypothetical protein